MYKINLLRSRVTLQLSDLETAQNRFSILNLNRTLNSGF